MKKIWILSVGLLCFAAGQARSETPAQTFEEQVTQGISNFSGDAGKVQQALAASKAQAAAQGCKGCGSTRTADDTDALDKAQRAHTTTWTTLFVLSQVHEPFYKAGMVKVDELPFWTEKGLFNAKLMAYAMDSVFVSGRGAKRKMENTRELLAEVLETGRSGGENVHWLADQIAGLYLFWDE